MTKSKPNVVQNEAALVARNFVYERRDAERIDPGEVVAKMLAVGCGSEFPPDVRGKRLRTWALQVLRRLRKRGWLDEPDRDGWPPTAELKACTDPEALGKRTPRRPAQRPPQRPILRPFQRPAPAAPAAPPAPAAPAGPAPQPVYSPPPPPESWEYYIQDWIFLHRDRDFGVVELAVAVEQRGFGTGAVGDRLDAARILVERMLCYLEEAGLVELNTSEDLWQTTELLRTWPTRD
jgi:hypothetical protein